MATRSQAIPSDWLKADPNMTIEGKSALVLTIAGIENGKSQFTGKPQRILTFEETHKKLGLGAATNWDACAMITGEPDDENWAGHKIELYAEQVWNPKEKKMTCGVRIRKPSSAASSVPSPSSPPPAASAPATPVPGKPFPANQVDAIKRRLEEYNADVDTLREGLVQWCAVPEMAVASKFMTDWDQSLTDNIRKVLDELKRCKNGDAEPAWKAESPF